MNKSDFQERLHLCRSKKGFSQTELAKVAGVSLRSIQNWELGGARPHGKHLRSLSQVLDVSIPYLLGHEDSPGAVREPVLFRKVAGESEMAMWKRRALESEKKLLALSVALRGVMDLTVERTAARAMEIPVNAAAKRPLPPMGRPTRKLISTPAQASA